MMTTGNDGKEYILDKNDLNTMIDVLSGTKLPMNHKLFENKSTSTTIKGDPLNGDISDITNFTITRAMTAYFGDNNEHEKEFYILDFNRNNDSLAPAVGLAIVNDNDIRLYVGWNNTTVAYLNAITDGELRDNILKALGVEFIGNRDKGGMTYMVSEDDKDILLSFGEYSTARYINENKEVNIKNKIKLDTRKLLG